MSYGIIRRKDGVGFLLVGGDSEIAAATMAQMQRDGVAVTATTRRHERLRHSGQVFLDLAQPLADWQPPSGVDAACLCAAIARLADCDRDPLGSALINVTRTIELTEMLVARGIFVLFLSTNQVFDGNCAHVPAEAPHSPVSEYGRQKAKAESRFRELIAKGAPLAILRLAKVVSPGMALLRQWQAALAVGQPIRAFDDMMMAPTPVTDVATAITALLVARITGVWQLTGAEDVSYTAIGGHIARRIGAEPELVQPVPAASAGMPIGSTPRHTTLDSSRLQQRFAIPVRKPWPVIDSLLDPVKPIWSGA
jgi:dTDP-4-dehydrorhamnose reductase